jgi:putative ABC transport system substrate-binding protein
MERRKFIAILGGSAIWPVAARAQTPGRTYRIGYLTFSTSRQSSFYALLDELRLAGFIEGQNLTVLDDGFGIVENELAAAAAALVKASPDAIFASGFVQAKAVQSVTNAIPILTLSEDLLAEGLTSSLARPDRNITGISLLSPELAGKRQDLMIEAVPGGRRMATLADANTTAPQQLKTLRDAASARGIELAIFTIRTPEDIVPAMDEIKASGAAAINVLASPLLFANRRLIIERTRELRLPAVYAFPDLAEQGGLIGYGPRFTYLYHLLGRQLVKILRGTSPADIPIEQPSRFELVVNLKTAKEIGLEIPANFVLRADKLIE